MYLKLIQNTRPLLPNGEFSVCIFAHFYLPMNVVYYVDIMESIDHTNIGKNVSQASHQIYHRDKKVVHTRPSLAHTLVIDHFFCIMKCKRCLYTKKILFTYLLVLWFLLHAKNGPHIFMQCLIDSSVNEDNHFKPYYRAVLYCCKAVKKAGYLSIYLIDDLASEKEYEQTGMLCFISNVQEPFLILYLIHGYPSSWLDCMNFCSWR